MDKLWTILMLVAYFTGLYAIGKIIVELCRMICGAFR